MKIVEIGLSKIRIPEMFKRTKAISEKELHSLVKSIDEEGLIQPVTVRPFPRLERGQGKPHPKLKNEYELISGYRRYLAYETLAKEKIDYATIPAVIRKLSDKNALTCMLAENLQRKDYSSWDKCTLLVQIYKSGKYFSIREMAKRLSIDFSDLSKILKIPELEPPIKKAFEKDKVGLGHVFALMRIKDKTQRIQIFKRIIEEGLSVDELRQELKLARQKESKIYRVIKSKSLKRLYGKRIWLQTLKTKNRLTIDFNNIEDLVSILSNIGGEIRKVK